MRVYGLALRALQSGRATRKLNSIEWNIAAFCKEPVWRELYGYVPRYGVPKGAGARRHKWEPGDNGPMRVALWVPCRACQACLKSRARLWAARAEREIRVSARTWMCTYTLRPEEHYKALCAGSLRYPYEDEFIARHNIISQEMTKYLKRVRKESGAKLRYILVCEAHKSGLPHYHALMHEPDPNRPVLKETLRDQWHVGFSRFKLVNQETRESIVKSGRYVSKYLSKSIRARVRASNAYGIDALTAECLILDNVKTHDPHPSEIERSHERYIPAR